MTDAPDWMKREAASIPAEVEKAPKPMPTPRLDIKQLISAVEAANGKMALLNELKAKGELNEGYAEAMTESVLALIADVHNRVAKANKP
jgi:hypothetical protein